MVLYYSLDFNLQSACTINAKIAKIDAIIDSLLNTAMVSVLNGDTIEYTIDTGQTKMNKVFASTASITNAIREYENIRNMYVNKLAPRIVRNVDSKNLRGRYGR